MRMVEISATKVEKQSEEKWRKWNKNYDIIKSN